MVKDVVRKEEDCC